MHQTKCFLSLRRNNLIRCRNCGFFNQADLCSNGDSAASHLFDLLAGQFSPPSLRALVPRMGKRTEEPLGGGVWLT